MSAIRKDLHDLQEKIERIERELSEVHLVLDKLTGTNTSSNTNNATLQDWRTAGTAGTAGTARPDQQVNKAHWGEWFDEWFARVGITVQPIGAEKLQTMMLGEGVRPEENLLSSGIIAMREE